MVLLGAGAASNAKRCIRRMPCHATAAGAPGQEGSPAGHVPGSCAGAAGGYRGWNQAGTGGRGLPTALHRGPGLRVPSRARAATTTRAEELDRPAPAGSPGRHPQPGGRGRGAHVFGGGHAEQGQQRQRHRAGQGSRAGQPRACTCIGARSLPAPWDGSCNTRPASFISFRSRRGRAASRLRGASLAATEMAGLSWCTCGHLAVDDHLHADGGGSLAVLFKELKNALQRHKQELGPGPPSVRNPQHANAWNAMQNRECRQQAIGPCLVGCKKVVGPAVVLHVHCLQTSHDW